MKADLLDPFGGLWAESYTANNLVISLGTSGNMFFSRIVALEIAEDVL